MNGSKLCLLIAVVLFVLAAFGVNPIHEVSLGYIGLAFFAASGLV